MRNITKWINDKFSALLKDRDYNGITEFLLLWNLFEDRLFENKFTIRNASEYINNHIEELDESISGMIFDYFKERYTDPLRKIVLYSYFEPLNFRDNDRKEFVNDTLLSDSPSIQHKILTSTIIIYRYRNNLFHGLKSVTQINYQKENFIHANIFLKMFIESAM